MNIFKKLRASIKLQEAIRQADKAHEETKERYYVIPTSDKKLAIVDRATFRKLKQKGYINSLIKVIDLERECFYCTSYSNGEGKLSDTIIKLKRKQYFDFIK